MHPSDSYFLIYSSNANDRYYFNEFRDWCIQVIVIVTSQSTRQMQINWVNERRDSKISQFVIRDRIGKLGGRAEGI